MGKESKQRADWYAIRHAHKKHGGPKTEKGPMTHNDARRLAMEWYYDGHKVEMQRRRTGEKAHVVFPKFPLIDRKRERARQGVGV